MTVPLGAYWLLRHVALPGVVCAIPAALVSDMPALLDLPASGMVFEQLEFITPEQFIANAKRKDGEIQ